MAAACEFDRLFTKNVPHILEIIFLSLDGKSVLNCMEVSKYWNDFLTSESFPKKGETIFCKDLWRELSKAAKDGNTDMVRRILASGMVEMTNKNKEPGTSPLLVAAEMGHKDVVQLLLNRGAKANMVNQHGQTPLHLAAWSGHPKVAKLLLDRGADPNIRDGFTPLHYAAFKGHKDAVKLILDSRAEPNMVNEMGDTPLHTPLHQAAREGHKDVVQLLLDRGADPSTATHNGYTPLQAAAGKGHKDVVKLPPG